MIKINNKEYNKYNVKIAWGNFNITSYGKKIKGIAPFITFNIKDNILIGIETRIPKEMLENTNLNEKINIKQYLTDITYEDEKGWLSLITGKYDCDIARIGDSYFKIELCIESEETEKINIIIDTNIELI